jgi:hypothetical protein
MLKKRFGQVAVKRMDVRYNIARYGAPGGGADAQELLFVASGPLAAQASIHANFHTRITGQVINVDGGHGLRRGPDMSAMLAPIFGEDGLRGVVN